MATEEENKNEGLAPIVPNPTQPEPKEAEGETAELPTEGTTITRWK